MIEEKEGILEGEDVDGELERETEEIGLEIVLYVAGLGGWDLVDCFKQLESELDVGLYVIVVLFEVTEVELLGVDVIVEPGEDGECNGLGGETEDEDNDHEDLIVKAQFRQFVEESLKNVAYLNANGLWVCLIDNEMEELL